MPLLPSERRRNIDSGRVDGQAPSTVYYASKAYVLSLSVALANEVAGSGVTVTCLCPGPTRTGFDRTAGNEKTVLFRKGHVMTPDEVARIGILAMLEGRPIAIAGFKNRMQAWSSGFAPRTWLAAIARKYQEPA